MTPKARRPVRRTFDVTYRVTTASVVDDLRRGKLFLPHDASPDCRLLQITPVPKP